MPEGLARQPIEKEDPVNTPFYPSTRRPGSNAAVRTEALEGSGLLVATLPSEWSR